MNEIGLAIRLARIAAGKAQWQVAAKVGVHPSTLNTIENGKRIPERELAESLLAEIGTDAPKTPLTAMVLKEAQRIAGSMR